MFNAFASLKCSKNASIMYPGNVRVWKAACQFQKRESLGARLCPFPPVVTSGSGCACDTSCNINKGKTKKWRSWRGSVIFVLKNSTLMGRKDTEGRSDIEKFRKNIGRAFIYNYFFRWRSFEIVAWGADIFAEKLAWYERSKRVGRNSLRCSPKIYCSPFDQCLQYCCARRTLSSFLLVPN